MSILHQNKIQNKKEIMHLDEIEKRKVVQHNDLISSVAKMDKTPLKIFELAVSCIDTNSPPKDNVIYLSKAGLFTFFDVSSSSKHSRFKEAITTLHKQSIFEIRELNDRQNKFEYEVISPLEKTKWNDYNDVVAIKFTSSIMPYLIDLKKNFTQYALADVMELNSKYSIVLYKWLSMHYNQYEHYKDTKQRSQVQLEEMKNPKIKVKDLRILTNTVTDYKLMHQFTEWVLEKPLKEINTHTHFNVSYEKIKKGRSIDAIRFHIEKKKIAPNINGNYKKEQDDPAYYKNKAEKEQKQKDLYAEAMQNSYTRLLSENNILFPEDFMNIETMAGLQREVYPLYKELETQKGLEGLKKHLSYVSSKQEGYSKRNITKYLKTAVSSYLNTF